MEVDQMQVVPIHAAAENQTLSVEHQRDRFQIEYPFCKTVKNTDQHRDLGQILHEAIEFVKTQEHWSDDNCLDTSDEFTDSDDAGDTHGTDVDCKFMITDDATEATTRNYDLSHLKLNFNDHLKAGIKSELCENTVNNNGVEYIHEHKTHVQHFNLEGLANLNVHSAERAERNGVRFDKKRIHKCDVCLKVFSKKSSLKDHVSIHTGNNAFHCDQCDVQCRTRNILSSHKRIKHLDLKYTCNICEKSFKHMSYVRTHMNIHRRTLFRCGFCNKSFSAKTTLTQHLNVHNRSGELGEENKYFMCDVCDKQFVSLPNLELHKEVHFGTQKYSCSTCGTYFSRNSDLQRHVRTHTGEKPYECSNCPLRFNTSGQLGMHVKTKHTNELTCPTCGKSYVRRCDFKRHVNTHTTEKETKEKYNVYKCEKCHLCLKSEINLINHLAKHAKDVVNNHMVNQPKGVVHTCKHCQKSFSTLSNKYRHIQRFHTLLKLCCDVCKKEFSSKESLKIHIESVHFNKRPYECRSCDRQFYKKKQLEKHVFKMHGLANQHEMKTK